MGTWSLFHKVAILSEKFSLALRFRTQRGSQKKVLQLAGGESSSIRNDPERQEKRLSLQTGPFSTSSPDPSLSHQEFSFTMGRRKDKSRQRAGLDNGARP